MLRKPAEFDAQRFDARRHAFARQREAGTQASHADAHLMDPFRSVCAYAMGIAFDLAEAGAVASVPRGGFAGQIGIGGA
jgi:hypothetical protein